jgi:hypothetical protein
MHKILWEINRRFLYLLNGGNRKKSIIYQIYHTPHIQNFQRKRGEAWGRISCFPFRVKWKHEIRPHASKSLYKNNKIKSFLINLL